MNKHGILSLFILVLLLIPVIPAYADISVTKDPVDNFFDWLRRVFAPLSIQSDPYRKITDFSKPINFGSPRSVNISYTLPQAARTKYSNVKVSLIDENGVVILTQSQSQYGYYATYPAKQFMWSLSESEIEKLSGKQITVTGANYIEYIDGLGFGPDPEDFYTLTETALVRVRTLSQTGFQGNLIVAGKSYVAFSVDGVLTFEVEPPIAHGTYIAVVSGIDPWTGETVQVTFDMLWLPSVIIVWTPERIGYIGEEYSVRFTTQNDVGDIIPVSFLPTVTITNEQTQLSPKVNYIATGTYEVVITPIFKGDMKLTAWATAANLEPGEATLDVEVLKPIAKVTYGIPTEEQVGKHTYQVDVYDQRNNYIAADVTFTIDRPSGVRDIIEGTSVKEGVYGISYDINELGIYYWKIDVNPTGVADPVTRSITMHIAEAKTPITELGAGFLTSPTFVLAILGLSVTVFMAMRRLRQE